MIISSPVDLIATNIYQAHGARTRFQVGAGLRGGRQRRLRAETLGPFHPAYPRVAYRGSNTLIELKFSPESVYWGTRLLVDLWNTKKIYTTESGYADVGRERCRGLYTDRSGWFHCSTVDNIELLFGDQSDLSRRHETLK